MAKQTKAAVAVAATPAQPARGGVMAARWGACLKGNTAAATTMPAAIKALPATTVITCLVANNPKRGASAPAFGKYAFGQGAAASTTGGPATVGATTTLAAFAAAHGSLSVAAGHVAWDLNHGYIAVAMANSLPALPAPAASAA